MAYTYKKYKDAGDIESTDVIQRIEDGAVIPFDEANKDYIEYKAWIDAGSTPQASD